jgi:hypothetical protein
VGTPERTGVVVKTSKWLLSTAFVVSAVCAQGGGAGAASGGGEKVQDLSVKQRPTLTSPEMLTAAKEYFANMDATMKRIQQLQEQSKRQKDIIRLNCVNDKLMQSKVDLTIAQQSMGALQESIARADEGGRAHEFTRLTIVNQKVLVLGTEAENCIGEDLSFVGATRVDVEIDPSLPKIDETLPTTPIYDPPRPDAISFMSGPAS